MKEDTTTTRIEGKVEIAHLSKEDSVRFLNILEGWIVQPTYEGAMCFVRKINGQAWELLIDQKRKLTVFSTPSPPDGIFIDHLTHIEFRPQSGQISLRSMNLEYLIAAKGIYHFFGLPMPTAMEANRAVFKLPEVS